MGSARRPPWLALHGWLDNSASFDQLAPLLPGQRLIAVDLPGHGLSDWRHADADYTFATWVPAIFEMAEVAKLPGRHHLHLDQAPHVAQVISAFIAGKPLPAQRPSALRRMH